MNTEIRLVKMRDDEDMVERHIDVSDGASKFNNRFYVGHHHLKEAITELNRFKDQVHGSIWLTLAACCKPMHTEASTRFMKGRNP